MTIRPKQLGLIDAIGAGVALLIAAGGYYLLIRSPLQEGARPDLVREACERAERELAAVRTETERLHQEVALRAEKLASIGGGLPEAREIDRYLARVIALATANGIAVDTLSPTPASEQGDHREICVIFVGRGAFAGFHRMLRAIERDLEYADVTHFSIAAGDAGTKSVCRLNWSLRICTTRNDAITKAVSCAEQS